MLRRAGFSRGGVRLYCGDCLEILPELESGSVDLVFGSPPYEDSRTYGIDLPPTGRGVGRLDGGGGSGVSAVPILLMADLHRAGVHLRKPPVFHRVGIPGRGGPDWLRNDYEFCVCATNGGRLPWSDNTAMGHPPKWALGGTVLDLFSGSGTTAAVAVASGRRAVGIDVRESQVELSGRRVAALMDATPLFNRDEEVFDEA